MLLSKATLGLAKLASKEASRYTLGGICIEAKQAIVTDGHTLVVLSHGTEQHKDAGFPETPGLEHKVLSDGPMTEQVMVSRDAALAALKALPKKTTIPVLANAALGVDGKLYVNSLDSVRSFTHKLEGKFPNWRAVMPAASKQVVGQVAMDARKLKALAEYIIDNCDERTPTMRITLYGESDAVRFDARTEAGQDVTALIMPIRMDTAKFPKRADEIAKESADVDAQAVRDKLDAKDAADEASAENVATEEEQVDAT